jgi:hypothetical protein
MGEFDAMFEPYGREDHLFFHKQMKKWAPVLKDAARIRISRQKHADSPGCPREKWGSPREDLLDDTGPAIQEPGHIRERGVAHLV